MANGSRLVNFIGRSLPDVAAYNKGYSKANFLPIPGEHRTWVKFNNGRTGTFDWDGNCDWMSPTGPYEQFKLRNGFTARRYATNYVTVIAPDGRREIPLSDYRRFSQSDSRNSASSILATFDRMPQHFPGHRLNNLGVSKPSQPETGGRGQMVMTNPNRRADPEMRANRRSPLQRAWDNVITDAVRGGDFYQTNPLTNIDRNILYSIYDAGIRAPDDWAREQDAANLDRFRADAYAHPVADGSKPDPETARAYQEWANREKRAADAAKYRGWESGASLVPFGRPVLHGVTGRFNPDRDIPEATGDAAMLLALGAVSDFAAPTESGFADPETNIPSSDNLPDQPVPNTLRQKPALTPKAPYRQHLGYPFDGSPDPGAPPKTSQPFKVQPKEASAQAGASGFSGKPTSVSGANPAAKSSTPASSPYGPGWNGWNGVRRDSNGRLSTPNLSVLIGYPGDQWSGVESPARVGDINDIGNGSADGAGTPASGTTWNGDSWNYNTFDPPRATLRTDIGNKTAGMLHVFGTPSEPLLSGIEGPSKSIRGQGYPGFNGNQLTHVEGHAAAHMRANGSKYAVLDITKVPCTKGRGGGCNGLLPKMLPPGSTLRVRGPEGYDQTFTGLPDKPEDKPK